MDVASLPQPGYNLAESINFSPDDNSLTYLRSSNISLLRRLYTYDLRTDKESLYAEPEHGNETSENNLSPEERLRHEVGVFY